MLDADPKAVSKLILYTGNLDQAGNTTYNNVFRVEKRKKKLLDVSEGTLR